jgi:glycosyltransferase involved in cell wall biosynthesis
MIKNIAIIENNILATNTIRQKLTMTLMEKGYHVTVLTTGTNEELETARSKGFNIIDVKASNQQLFDIWLYMRNIKKGLKFINADLCLTFTIRPAIWGNIITRQLKIPTITNITGIGPLFESNHFTYKAARALYKFVLKKTRKVFFQNENDMSLFLEKKFVPPDKAIRIPGSGVDHEYYKPIEIKKPNNKMVFLFISRLIKDKGIVEFVEAARILKDQLPDAEFCVLGGLWSQNLKTNIVTQSELSQWVNEGLINYLGAAADVRPYIASADCIVLPSYREGMSNVLLEAGSMGKPCVTCDTPGCKDIVIDGVTGFLCKTKNAKDLADKMKKMYLLSANERCDMGARARNKIIKEFDKEIVINAYLKAIDEINTN